MIEKWTDKVKYRYYTCYDINNERYKIDYKNINLYIVMTRHCNTKCKFCTFRGEELTVDLDIFKKIYSQLTDECKVFTVHFTGGEPTLELDKVKEICKYIKSIESRTITSINTNGTRLNELEGIDELDNIALSRHHYLDSKNQELFGSDLVPTVEDIRNFKEKHKLHLSCNLVKGYIDSADELQKYLDFVGTLDINDIGIVNLMKVNDYCKKNFVEYDGINIKSIDNTFNSRRFKSCNDNGDTVCKCENYIYRTPYFKLVSMYHRYAIKNDEIASYLVYEDNHIKQGFNGTILV